MLNVECSAHLDPPIFDIRYNGNTYYGSSAFFWEYRTEVIVNLYAVFLFQIYWELNWGGGGHSIEMKWNGK